MKNWYRMGQGGKEEVWILNVIQTHELTLERITTTLPKWREDNPLVLKCINRISTHYISRIQHRDPIIVTLGRNLNLIIVSTCSRWGIQVKVNISSSNMDSHNKHSHLIVVDSTDQVYQDQCFHLRDSKALGRVQIRTNYPV